MAQGSEQAKKKKSTQTDQNSEPACRAGSWDRARNNRRICVTEAGSSIHQVEGLTRVRSDLEKRAQEGGDMV